jgi:hypothetical protein
MPPFADPGAALPNKSYTKTRISAKALKKHYRTGQDTPQDKERLKITPTIQEIQDKEQHRRATTSHRKANPKEHEWGYQEESIEGCDAIAAKQAAGGASGFRNEFRHR